MTDWHPTLQPREKDPDEPAPQYRGSFDQASQNLAASDGPDAKPSCVKPCSTKKPLWMGIFFDGTRNNRSREDKTHYTNVTRLYDAYGAFEDQKDFADHSVHKMYIPGVGGHAGPHIDESDPGTGTGGAGFGTGMQFRIQLAYGALKSAVTQHFSHYGEDSDVLVDVYGFSRGAAAARTFVNLVNQALREAEHGRFRNVRVRFVGLFDTVASTGLPTFTRTSMVGLNLGLKTGDFKACRHATARHEFRTNYPLCALDCGKSVAYPGAHSDVGGGYGEGKNDDEGKSNWLAGAPLWDMWKASVAAEVKFHQPPQMPDVGPRGERAPMGESDVTTLRAYNGTVTTWANFVETRILIDPKERFIHDSAQQYPGGETFTNGVSEKREVIRPARFTLATPPPNYSWK